MAKKLLLFFAASLLSVGLSAQRTSPGAFVATLGGTCGVTPSPGSGGFASVGKYGLDSYWAAGAGIYTYDETQTLGDISRRYGRYLVTGDWMYRLAGTYSRSANLYVGGGADLGFENCTPVVEALKVIHADDEDGGYDFSTFKTKRFAYGFHAAAELELYLSRMFGFVLGVKASLPFTGNWYVKDQGSKSDILNPGYNAKEPVVTTNTWHLDAFFGIRLTL